MLDLSDAWLHCICTHTRTHPAHQSNLHCISHSFSLRSSIPPPTDGQLSLASYSISTRPMFYLTCTAPCGSLRFPAQQMSCPFPRPGYAGSRSTHPVPTKRPTAMAWYPRGSVALPRPQLACVTVARSIGRAREYSRVGGRGVVVGHTGIWEGAAWAGVHNVRSVGRSAVAGR